MSDLTEEEIREIKHRSVVTRPTPLDVSKLVSMINFQKDEMAKLQYKFDLHHNYYKCVARSVADAEIESVQLGYRKLVQMAFKLIRELRAQNSPLPNSIEAFSDYAKILWEDYDDRRIREHQNQMAEQSTAGLCGPGEDV